MRKVASLLAQPLSAENVVWTAGNRPNAKLQDFDLPLTKRDGVIVDEYLRVPGRTNIWAIGDSAAIPYRDGEIVPPPAQAAVQEDVRAVVQSVVLHGRGVRARVVGGEHDGQSNTVALSKKCIRGYWLCPTKLDWVAGAAVQPISGGK